MASETIAWLIQHYILPLSHLETQNHGDGYQQVMLLDLMYSFQMLFLKN